MQDQPILLQLARPSRGSAGRLCGGGPRHGGRARDEKRTENERESRRKPISTRARAFNVSLGRVTLIRQRALRKAGRVWLAAWSAHGCVVTPEEVRRKPWSHYRFRALGDVDICSKAPAIRVVDQPAFAVAHSMLRQRVKIDTVAWRWLIRDPVGRQMYCHRAKLGENPLSARIVRFKLSLRRAAASGFQRATTNSTSGRL